MTEKSPYGMPSMEIPNDSVAGAAKECRDAAELLYSQPPAHICVLPVMLLGALALELYLKSLNTKTSYHDLAEERGVPGGYRLTAEPVQKAHRLTELYDGLHATIQAELDQFYALRRAAPEPATIRDALHIFDDLFVSSRYWFENQWAHKEGRCLSDLVALVRLVGNFVVGLRKRTIG